MSERVRGLGISELEESSLSLFLGGLPSLHHEDDEANAHFFAKTYHQALEFLVFGIFFRHYEDLIESCRPEEARNSLRVYLENLNSIPE